MIQAIAQTPWAITADGLEMILGIAQRNISDYEAVLSTPAIRKEGGTISVRDNIAIINVMGSIFPRANLFSEISGATSVETLALKFSEALNDDSIKGIVLHIDSPGGQVTGIHEFANMIYNARGTKPIKAYVSSLGASAAYWIASATDSISLDATALVGSIGIVCAWTDDTKAKEAEGYRDYKIVSSKSPNKQLDPKTEKGRELLLKNLDEITDVFISDVARNRRVTIKKVEEKFGQGGVVTAAESIKIGMADELNSLEGVIADLKNISFNKMGGTLMNGSHEENLVEAASEANNFSSKKLEKNSDNPIANELDEAKLLASNPNLYNSIVQNSIEKGVAQERERIKAIDDMNFASSNKKLIEDAKYGNPCSAQELAYKIIKGQRAATDQFNADYQEDKAALNGVSASPDATSGSTETSFNSDIQAIVKGVKGNG